MFEIKAEALQAGDDFTVDDGATWLKVNVVRRHKNAKRVVVVDNKGKERTFKYEDGVVVR